MKRLLMIISMWPATVWADVPRVITDIAPIHSLTAIVMGDLGEPDLLLPPGANPHDYQLRPSDAARVAEADAIIWVGHGLTPWLEDPLDALAAGTRQLELLESDGWDQIMWDPEDDHDHGHGHDDHGTVDPHGWLDPQVATVWLTNIAETLAEMDPVNEAAYRANAAGAADEFAGISATLTDALRPLAGAGYIVPHDGYAYFERAFGLAHVDALSDIGGGIPGPAKVQAIQARVAETGINCVFYDRDVGQKWMTLVTDRSGAKSAFLDGLGGNLEPGATLYPQMLGQLSDAFASCLGD